MTKHTKGPWSISERNAPAGYVSIDGDRYEALALVVWQMDEDKVFGVNSPSCEANAHLIKAAPKLFAALTDALEDYEAWLKGTDANPNESLLSWTNKARDAIAEAKGEL